MQNAINLDKMISPSVKSLLARVASKLPGSKDVIINKNDIKTPGAPANKVSTGSESTFGQLNLTIAKFYRISGNSTQHKGVLPDISYPSLIPMDKYGEDTEPSALPFDIINKSTYAPAGNFASVLPQLKKLHDQRMSTSADYKYLMEDVAEMKKNEAETSVTLNEAALKKEHDEDDKKQLDRTNLKRAALGLRPLKKGETASSAEKKLVAKSDDFLKVESGQILTDYISLDNKLTGVSPRPAN